MKKTPKTNSKGLKPEKNGDLTSGSLPGVLLRFSVPFLISNLLQTLYGLADLFIIGRFCGKECTAAVSVGSQVMHMLTVVTVGLCMGVTVGVGNAVGEGSAQKARRAAGTGLTVLLGAGLVIAAVLELSVNGVVRLMSAPQEAVEDTRAYLGVCFAGLPAIVLYNLISAVFRAAGDSATPMFFTAGACAVNVALELGCVGGLKLGPAGAAWGTVIAQTLSAACACVYYRRKRRDLFPARTDLKPGGTETAKLLRVGLPVAAQDGFIQISFLVITVIANRRGLDTAAAVGVVEKLIGFFFLVPSAMLSSVSAVAAQNFGAGRADRARLTLRYSAFAAAVVGLALSVFTQFLAPGLVGLFTRDAAVVRMGAQYLRGYVWDCMLAGVHFCFSGYFCAMSRSMLSFIHNVISIVFARIPLAWWASVTFVSLFPMGLAPTVGSLISVAVCLLMYRALQKQSAAELFSTDKPVRATETGTGE